MISGSKLFPQHKRKGLYLIAANLNGMVGSGAFVGVVISLKDISQPLVVSMFSLVFLTFVGCWFNLIAEMKHQSYIQRYGRANDYEAQVDENIRTWILWVVPIGIGFTIVTLGILVAMFIAVLCGLR